MTSPIDTAAVEQKVRDLYRANLNRDADAAGLAFYTDEVLNGATLETVDHQMEASPEYASLHGASGLVAGNGRALLLAGALGLLVLIVIRRQKK